MDRYFAWLITGGEKIFDMSRPKLFFVTLIAVYFVVWFLAFLPG